MFIELNIHSTSVESEYPQAIFKLCCLDNIEQATILSIYNKIEIHVIVLSQNCEIKEVAK